MKNTNNTKKGFTLIEMLVAMTVISIIAGLNFYDFNDKYESMSSSASTKGLICDQK